MMNAIKDPLISFIVPVYNAERTLEDCIRSVTRQSFGDIEIILVNNCSTDASLQKCNELAKVDGRIRVVDVAEKGVSAARNSGIELATGEYVTFVDADDWIDSDVCEIFARLNAKHDYDLFCISAQYHNGCNTVKTFLFKDNVDLLSESQKEELQIKIFAPKAPCFEYKVNTRFAGSVWSKFYKREILQKNNLRFATGTIISEDCLFNTLALDHFCRIGYTKDCFYHYIQQSNSAQNRYRPESAKYFSFIIRKIQLWLLKTSKGQIFIDAANCLFVHYLFGILKEDLFHKDNPYLYAEKKRSLESILSMAEFREPLESFNRKFFSLPERVLIWLLQKRQIGLIFFALGLFK